MKMKNERWQNSKRHTHTREDVAKNAHTQAAISANDNLTGILMRKNPSGKFDFAPHTYTILCVIVPAIYATSIVFVSWHFTREWVEMNVCLQLVCTNAYIVQYVALNKHLEKNAFKIIIYWIKSQWNLEVAFRKRIMNFTFPSGRSNWMSENTTTTQMPRKYTLIFGIPYFTIKLSEMVLEKCVWEEAGVVEWKKTRMQHTSCIWTDGKEGML